MIFILLPGLLAVACQKPADDALEKITDTIVGRYECRSIVIQGQELDLNGDGSVGNDMIREFDGYDFAQSLIESTPVRVYAVKGYDREASISLEIPKQCVNYDKKSAKYAVVNDHYGTSMAISFLYSVDESGRINARPNIDSNKREINEDNDTIYMADFLNNSAESIVFDQKGGISALVNCTCYDYRSDILLTVPVLFTYERTSYSVN